VAASALDMAVADPRPLLARVDRDRLDRILRRRRNRLLPEVRAAEPQIELAPPQGSAHATGAAGGTVRARVQRFGDAVDTDAMIPGEFCHLTEPKELGAHAFHYVRPEFAQRARDGATIVVAGEGWGTGSSREQAVWALQGAGIVAVIARSYGFIHKRNLVNEALPFLVLRDPAFDELVGEGDELEIDVAGGTVRHVASGREFQAQTPTPMIRALQGEGGLVPAIQHHGGEVFAALSA
jgi:aconitate hydratase/homoaconitate hydratase